MGSKGGNAGASVLVGFDERGRSHPDTRIAVLFQGGHLSVPAAC